ncbi:MAG: hypothetical protein JO022_06920 [Acidobacteriaceae bacterium]|nr:hypothetical protein [Acidobacteriaceae bacterium]
MVETVHDTDAVLNRFNKLMQELLRGNIHRNTFHSWEVQIMLDIDACSVREGAKRETLRRYQRAVQRSMEKGAPAPILFSEYLNQQKARRAV